jgi:large subunit ribosomal protein L21
MYAVIKTGGKQYVVLPDQRVRVEKLAADKGTTVTFPVLFYKEENKAGQLDTSHLTVKATVLDQIRGDKIKIIKSRRRKHSRKQMGHRQYYTIVQINSIGS